MNTANRFRMTGGLILLVGLAFQPLLAQENSPVDLTGTWRWLAYEDNVDRAHGVEPGQYDGVPLNDAARMRADTYAEEWVSTSPLLQCRPRAPMNQPYGLDPMQIEKEVDPLSRQIVAYRVSFHKTPGARMVWLDSRPGPSEYGAHTWEGFSTGKFKGDTLEITTTHFKESFITRNGVPSSFRAKVIEQVFLREPYLHWVFTVIDPDYLSEPLVRSGLYVRSPVQQLPPYPCQSEDNQPPGARTTSYKVPHYLPGENPYLTEAAFKLKLPLEGWRGGAETLYPEWHANAMKLPPPAAPNITLKPVYSDGSTHIAERADTEPKRAASYDKVEAVHVAGNVYMIGGAGGNIAASVGGDGVFLVDTGVGPASDKVLSVIRQVAQMWRPVEMPESASPYNSTWQVTHAFAEAKIRMIINTNDSADHVGGNANIRKSPMFGALGEGAAYQLPLS